MQKIQTSILTWRLGNLQPKEKSLWNQWCLSVMKTRKNFFFFHYGRISEMHLKFFLKKIDIVATV